MRKITKEEIINYLVSGSKDYEKRKIAIVFSSTYEKNQVIDEISTAIHTNPHFIINKKNPFEFRNSYCRINNTYIYFSVNNIKFLVPTLPENSIFIYEKQDN